jgi:hypothetical protein
MPKSHVVAQDSTGRACCTRCRIEFDARRSQGCPICVVTGRRRPSTDERPTNPREEAS